jgi:hypothetical protein
MDEYYNVSEAILSSDIEKSATIEFLSFGGGG